MPWEYKIVEGIDYGHPGGSPRYQEFLKELTRLSEEGWEVDHLVPSMQRGRTEVPGGRGEGSRESSSHTAVAILALLKRRTE